MASDPKVSFPPRWPRKGLRVVALIEATKALAVPLIAVVIWSAMHRHPAASANHLIAFLHWNRGGHPAHVLYHVLADVLPHRVVLVGVLVVLYTLARCVEAFGLWNAWAWAQWFGIVSGALYIPVELYEIGRRATWTNVGIFVANVVVVGYLVFVRVSEMKLRAVGHGVSA